MKKTKQTKQKFEFENICKKCGAENTLWPKWIGRKRVYVCVSEEGGCGEVSCV